MECQSSSDGLSFESQTQESSAVSTVMSAEVISTICVVCLNEIQNSEDIKEEGPEPLTLTRFNLLSCIGINNALEVSYDSLTLCNNCISFVEEWACAQEEISMLRSKCSQIKAKLLSLILQSTSKTLQDEGPSPAASVLRNAVSREYSVRVNVQKLEDQMGIEEEYKIKHEPEESAVPITYTSVGSDEMPHDPDVRIEDCSDEMPHDPDVGLEHCNEMPHDPDVGLEHCNEISHDPDVRIEDCSDSSSSNSIDEFQGHVMPGPSSLNLPKHPRREQKVTASLLSTIVSHLTNNSDRFDENSSIHRGTLIPSASMNKVTKTRNNLQKNKSNSWSPKKYRSKRRRRSHASRKSSNTYSEISDLVEIDLECPEIDDVSIKMEPVEDDDSTSQDQSYPFSNSLWSSIVPDEVQPDSVNLDQSRSNHHVDNAEDNSVSLNAPIESESTSIPITVPVSIIDESWMKTEPPDLPPQSEAEL